MFSSFTDALSFISSVYDVLTTELGYHKIWSSWTSVEAGCEIDFFPHSSILHSQEKYQPCILIVQCSPFSCLLLFCSFSNLRSLARVSGSSPSFISNICSSSFIHCLLDTASYRLHWFVLCNTPWFLVTSIKNNVPIIEIEVSGN